MITPKEIQEWQRSVTAFGRPIRGTELAVMLGVAHETYSRWRTRGVNTERETAIRLAMAAISAGLRPWRTQGEK